MKRSDDLRPLGPRTWATLSDEARAALDAYGVKPPPFDLEGQEPTAVILNWNDPQHAIALRRAAAARHRKPAKQRQTIPAPPPPPAAPRPAPNLNLAKSLVGLSSMSSSKIAAFCNLPVSEVEAMRASREQAT